MYVNLARMYGFGPEVVASMTLPQAVMYLTQDGGGDEVTFATHQELMAWRSAGAN